MYRADLPQGIVLPPALFLAFCYEPPHSPLNFRGPPGTTTLLYADDTAALCSGHSIEVARERTQQAADVSLLSSVSRPPRWWSSARRGRRWSCHGGSVTLSLLHPRGKGDSRHGWPPEAETARRHPRPAAPLWPPCRSLRQLV